MIEATQSGDKSDATVGSDGAGGATKPPEPDIDAEPPAEEGAAEALPLDVTFEILKNRRRRLVLEYLRDAEETTIGELAEHIAAIENETTVQQLNAQQRKRVYIGLYQCHLPKMDDAGVVEFNQDRGHVALGESVEPLYKYLDIDDDTDDEAAFSTVHASGYVAFTALFFVAQLSNAYAIASGIVVIFLLATLWVTYRVNSQ
jgi:DNA-binding transcriptional ArsR family regulator